MSQEAVSWPAVAVSSLHSVSAHKSPIPPITLFHLWKPRNLFAFWQVEVLSSRGPNESRELWDFFPRRFVATAHGHLKLRSNMCLCLFRCGFPMETRTLPWPDSQMYPVYDSVWSQSPIFKILHSCSEPQPDYRVTVLYCSVENIVFVMWFMVGLFLC